jgi:hypothetical protein
MGLRGTIQRLRHRHVPRLLVQPAATPPLSHQVWGRRLSLCAPGARSKAGGEHPSGSTQKASLVRTPSARTSAFQTLSRMRLLGDGKHGLVERIQTFRCQACRTTFTARRHTPLSRLKTPSQQIAMVLTALAEGLDPSEAWRVFGSRQATISSLSDSRGLVRTDLARAFLLPSAAPTPPTG